MTVYYYVRFEFKFENKPKYGNITIPVTIENDSDYLRVAGDVREVLESRVNAVVDITSINRLN